MTRSSWVNIEGRWYYSAAGTLSGLGSQYLDFARIVIDPSARWTIAGADTLTASDTLSSGTAVNNGLIGGGAAHSEPTAYL